MLGTLLMSNAFDAITNSITREFKRLRFAVLGRVHYLLRTGNMKFTFDRMYLENRDPWNYRYSKYERDKYDGTLGCALAWRNGQVGALELGCSIGVFTAMISDHFEEVTGVDVSREALRTAAHYNRNRNNISFRRCDMRSLALGKKFDVIFCAEVLYYIRERDAPTALQRLAEHLSPNGVIIFVAGTAGHNPTPFCWRATLAASFRQVFVETVDDPVRPYEIAVFSQTTL